MATLYAAYDVDVFWDAFISDLEVYGSGLSSK